MTLGLTHGEYERLALLLEEMGEAQQCIGKILRHGYESYDPTLPKDMQITNREDLERELGHVKVAVNLLTNHRMNGGHDLNAGNIDVSAQEKIKRIGKYLHHQERQWEP
jgi:hypothetical protein